MNLENHPFLASLPASIVGGVTESSNVRVYAKHDVIFDEGSVSDELFLLLRGSVAMQKRFSDGSYRTVSRIKDGNHFGEIGVFTQAPRSLRAVAMDEVEVAAIPAETVRSAFQHIPAPARDVIEGLINHLSETTAYYTNHLLQQEKMELISSMAESLQHSFQDPFFIIEMGMDLIQSNYPDEKTTRLCQNLHAQVNRMRETLMGLHEISLQPRSLKKDPISLRELMKEFREINYNFFNLEDIDVEIDVPDCTFPGTRPKLLQILQQLFDNAVSALATVENAKITITAELPPERVVVIRITDNGPGIPEVIRETLFDPFVAHGGNRGAGLGTTIARALVEAHGGSIRFETSSEGTAFIIKLPRGEG